MSRASLPPPLPSSLLTGLRYTSSSIPEVLAEMQNLEEMRLNCVRVHLDKFGALLKPLSKMFLVRAPVRMISSSSTSAYVSIPAQDLSGTMVSTASSIDVAADISRFADNTYVFSLVSLGALSYSRRSSMYADGSRRLAPFTYSLGIPLDHIKKAVDTCRLRRSIMPPPPPPTHPTAQIPPPIIRRLIRSSRRQ